MSGRGAAHTPIQGHLGRPEGPHPGAGFRRSRGRGPAGSQPVPASPGPLAGAGGFQAETGAQPPASHECSGAAPEPREDFGEALGPGGQRPRALRRPTQTSGEGAGPGPAAEPRVHTRLHTRLAQEGSEPCSPCTRPSAHARPTGPTHGPRGPRMPHAHGASPVPGLRTHQLLLLSKKRTRNSLSSALVCMCSPTLSTSSGGAGMVTPLWWPGTRGILGSMICRGRTHVAHI